MLIKDVMTKEVLTVKRDLPFTEACELFFKNKIHHLPVVDKNHKLVGMFTSNDALKGFVDNVFNSPMGQAMTIESNITVGDLMSDKLIWLNAYDDITQAVLLFKEFGIHAIAVMEKDEIIGILTSNDVMNTYQTVGV